MGFFCLTIFGFAYAHRDAKSKEENTTNSILDANGLFVRNFPRNMHIFTLERKSYYANWKLSFKMLVLNSAAMRALPYKCRFCLFLACSGLNLTLFCLFSLSFFLGFGFLCLIRSLYFCALFPSLVRAQPFICNFYLSLLFFFLS